MRRKLNDEQWMRLVTRSSILERDSHASRQLQAARDLDNHDHARQFAYCERTFEYCVALDKNVEVSTVGAMREWLDSVAQRTDWASGWSVKQSRLVIFFRDRDLAMRFKLRWS